MYMIEFTVFNTLAKMWLETKGNPPDHKQYIVYTTTTRAKKSVTAGNLPPQQPAAAITMNSLTMYGKPLKAPSGTPQMLQKL